MAKKYYMHKITKKEAQKLAALCEVDESVITGAYCLTNKKGEMLSVDGEARVCVGDAFEAAVALKMLADKKDVSFKIPSGTELLSKKFEKKCKLQIPNKPVSAVQISRDSVSEQFSKIEETLGVVAEYLGVARDLIKSAAKDAKLVDLDISDRYEDEFADEDGEEYDEDEYDEDEYDER